MSRLQWILIGGAIGLFLLIFFGLNITSSELESEEKKRAMNVESVSVSNLVLDAKKALSSSEHDLIAILESKVGESKTEESKIDALKQLASYWYDYKNPAISGYYAEKIAEMDGDAEAYSIAGTTFMLALKNKPQEKVGSFCIERSVACFEKAISLDPENIDYRINHALCFVENPPQENPMKGVLMLLDLNKKNPDDAKVLFQLGRLGMQTGQFEKAIGRFEKALAIDPTMIKANCMLAEAYEKTGDKSKAEQYLSLCK